MTYQICSFVILIIFYGLYFGKMIVQKKQGIETDQMAKGKKDKHLFVIEITMKIATYIVVIVEIVSILIGSTFSNDVVRFIGIGLSIIGVVVFGLAIYTMKDSWRAGIPEEDKTKIVMVGIYSRSRNPAFLGFDLVYIGILLTFFNVFLLLSSLFAITMLHIQVIQEEKYLQTVFGEEYTTYKSRVRRYVGIKIM